MKKNYEYKNVQVKLIIDEEPMVNDYTFERLNGFVERKCDKIIVPQLIGLEVSLSKGGRICYGLLACKLIPNDKQDIVGFEISYIAQNTIKYTDSILFNDNYVYKGLPKEYLKHVEAGIMEGIKEAKFFPNCNLHFDYAANCEVGSSPLFFEMISETLIELIGLDLNLNICELNATELLDSFSRRLKF